MWPFKKKQPTSTPTVWVEVTPTMGHTIAKCYTAAKRIAITLNCGVRFSYGDGYVYSVCPDGTHWERKPGGEIERFTWKI